MDIKLNIGLKEVILSDGNNSLTLTREEIFQLSQILQSVDSLIDNNEETQ